MLAERLVGDGRQVNRSETEKALELLCGHFIFKSTENMKGLTLKVE